MSTTLLLGSLRQQLGVALGEGDVTGTFTNAPGVLTTAIDANRFDGDRFWNNAFIQDLTQANFPITRIASWTQQNNTFTLYQGFVTSAGQDDYEVHNKLSFFELRNAINNGIALCGQSLRQTVRDQTQVLISNQYQYTPNYTTPGNNRFFPLGVMRCEYQFWTGQPTAPFYPVAGWEYLDDEVLQFPMWIVDSYAGNPFRMTGYGPVTAPITTDDPAYVIGTFDDDFMIQMLMWACTHQAWNILKAKLSANERSAAIENAQMAFQQFDQARKAWSRRTAIARSVILPVSVGGWQGNSR